MGDKNNAKFFEILKNHKIIFKKSQVPSVRVAKENALSSLHEEYLLKFGQEITISQLRKKIQNMRNDVKKKTDLRATGNKPINLKDWERALLELMEEESNPVFNKIPGAMDVSFGVETEKTPDSVGLETPIPKKRKVSDEMDGTKNVGKKQKFDDETEETKNLSNQELQRLVLLRQLKLLNLDISEREEKKKVQQKMEKEKDECMIKDEFEVEMLDDFFEEEMV